MFDAVYHAVVRSSVVEETVMIAHRAAVKRKEMNVWNVARGSLVQKRFLIHSNTSKLKISRTHLI